MAKIGEKYVLWGFGKGAKLLKGLDMDMILEGVSAILDMDMILQGVCANASITSLLFLFSLLLVMDLVVVVTTRCLSCNVLFLATLYFTFDCSNS